MNRRLLSLLACLSFAVPASAQLYINEISQGSSGSKEFVEFVVAGTRTCTDSTLDIRGYIFDDNPGWYTTTSVGVGCYRFANISNWSAVKYGSLIVIYNAQDKNLTLPADDSTDANGDGVYVLPSTCSFLQVNNASPASGGSATYNYSAAVGGTWSTPTSTSWNNALALGNGGDAFQIINPAVSTTVAAHSISYGTNTGGAQTANVYFSALGGATVGYLSGSTPLTQSAWTTGSATTSSATSAETPGAGNSSANSAWISGMKTTVTRLYVDASVVSTGNGSSWATALKTLDSALRIVNKNTCVQDIWVKAGTYYPMAGVAVAASRDSTLRITRNGVKIYGGFAGTETLVSQRNVGVNATILSGDIGTANDSTDNVYTVVTFNATLANVADTVHSMLDGFTVQKGNGNSGYPGSASIAAQNQAGGILVKAAAGQTTNADIYNCIVNKNFGVYGGGYSTWANGSGAKTGSTAYNTAFESNHSVYGGAICYTAFPAGGTGVSGLQNCVFTNNITNSFASAILNDADGAGCALTTTISNCTFSEQAQNVFYNFPQNGGTSTIAVNNSIIWKSGGQYTAIAGGGGYSFTNCDLDIATPGSTNINTSPFFINSANSIGADNIWGTSDDGLQLYPCSGAVNAGANALVPSSLTTDLTGSTARILESVVDMGAYEQTGGKKLFVNGAVATSGSGFTWGTAFKTLTEALTFANTYSCADTIWVATGTYYPSTAAGAATTSRDSSFRILRNGVKVYGGFAGTETLLSQRNVNTNLTTLSGDIGTVNDTTDNSYHVVTIVTGTGTIDSSTRLDGFTITKAIGGISGTGTTTVNGLTFNRADGGGIYIGGGTGGVCSPLIANCTVTDNTANFGGAVYCNAYSSSTASAKPAFSSCTFSLNRANTSGGAVYINGNPGFAEPTFNSCTFSSNSTNSLLGGAVAGTSDVTTYTSCTFSNNTATTVGGAVYGTNDTLTFTGCTFSGNSANNATATDGGAITSVNTSLLTVSNCTFSNNTGTNLRGAAISATGQSSISNSIFSNNSSANGGAVSNAGGGTKTMTVSSCKFSSNTAATSGGALYNQGGAALTVSNSSFTGNTASGGGGGAVYAQSTGLVTFTSDTLTGNKASANGGGLSNNTNASIVTACLFTGNRATGNGGGINATGTLALTGNIFSRDTAANGGGIYTNSSSRVAATANFLQANVSLSGGSGAGIYTANSNDSIANNVLFANRDIGGTGGGGMNIYTGSTNTVFIANNTYYSDTTAGVGGAIRLNGTGTFNVYNNLSWGNYANGIYDISNNTSTGVVMNSSNNYFAPDPLFTNPSDPDGADNLWGTADDGLQLQSCSPAIAFGINPPMSNYANDVRGATRTQQTNVDAGAYESAYANSVTTPGVSMMVSPGTIISNGTTVTFTATATNAGTTPNYQWKKNGTNAGTGTTYSTNSLANGDIVTCVVTTSAACPSQSTAFSESVFYTKPVVTITPSQSCTGGTDTLNSNPQPAFFNLNIGGVAQATQYATWNQTATTVAGGNGSGSGVNQFNQDFDSKIDNNGNLYVVDYNNSRVVKWAPPYTSGVVVAGGNGAGSALNQLNQPLGIDIDGSGNLYITDQLNYRVVKWAPGATSGVVVAGGNGPGSALNQFQKVYGVVVDSIGNMYISDQHNHRVTKWTPGATSGIVVAGNNGQGSALNQLNLPAYISVDKAANVYVMDQYNDRVVKWAAGASAGTVVAGGNGYGSGLSQIGDAPDVFVDENGIIYFADLGNARVMRWLPGATSGTVIAAGNGAGNAANQINSPIGIEMDAAGNIYIADRGNNRVQKFAINTTPYTFPIATAISYSASVTTVGAATDTAAAINVITSVTPTVSIAANPTGAICSGTNVAFTATPTNGGTMPQYQWLRNGVYVGAAVTTYADATLTNGSTIQVRVISNATCRTADTVFSNIITETVNPTPAISGTSYTNPPTCGSTSGTITLNGLTTGATYTVSYSYGGVAQMPVVLTAAGGAVTLTGLATGTYTNISVTSAAGCPSNVIAGPVTITPPSSPVISGTAFTNPTTCSGTDGTITLNGLSNGASYTISYSLGGLAQTPLTLVASSSSVTLTGLSAGSYSNFAVTLAGCGSNAVAGPIVLSDPAAPTLTSITPLNPSTCGGTNGSITLNGLTASTTYSISYSNGASTVTIVSATTDAAGSYAISGLSAGTYSSFTVSRIGCTGSYAGPVTLSPPATPAAPTAGSNGPLCSGASLSLTATPTISGGSYAWTGSNGFTSNAQNTGIASATTAASGTYSVTVKVANCTSLPGTIAVVVNQTPAQPTVYSNGPICAGASLNLNAASTTSGVTYSWTGPNGFSTTQQNPVIASATTAATGIYTAAAINSTATSCTSSATLSVTVNAVPTITSSSSSSPTTCGGTSGSITLNGLTANGVYAISYQKNSTPQTATISANASGVLTISGLTQGTYTSITAAQNGCSSNSAGPFTLTDPATPPAPTATSNSPVCQGATLTLGATGQTGAIFNWSGPASYSSTGPNPTVTTNMQAANAGTYSVTQTVAGCISPAATTVAALSTPPAQPGSVSGAVAPCAGSTQTYSISPVTGATSYSWTIPGGSGWSTAGSTGTSINVTTGSTSGTVSVAAVNICGPGTPATLTVTPNATPAQPAAISGPANVCSGATTSYYITAVPNAASYTWSFPAGWTTSGSTNGASVNAVAGTAGGSITVVASNVCGPSAAQSLAVTVTSAPGQPGAISGTATPCINSTQTYSVAAVTGATSYNWSFPGGGTPAWAATASGNTLSATVGAASGNISVSAVNVCGTSAARTLGITVTQLPAQPAAISGKALPCIGNTETYSVPAVAGAISYQWSVPNGWTGASTTNTLNVIVSNSSGAVSVTPVGVCGAGPGRTLAVTATPVVTSSVKLSRSTPSDTICAGTAVTFTATATGGGSTPAYVFKKNGTAVFAAGNSYTDNALANGDVVTVTMASSLPCVTASQVSDSIKMTVNPLVMPGININTVPPTVLCAGTTISFVTNNAGGGSSPAYQWYKNGLPVSGATSSGYVTSALANGDTIQVKMTSSAACPAVASVFSNKVGLNVANVVVPTISITANPSGAVAPGTSVQFTAVQSGGGAKQDYQWRRNGVDIPNETGATYTSNALQNGDRISVRMQSYAPCAKPGVVTSNEVAMQIGTTAVPALSAWEGAITLYPNPTTGRFTVSVSWSSGHIGKRATLDVLNTLGQPVYHVTLQPDRREWSHEVWLNDALANGTYLLRISTEDGMRAALPFVLGR